MFVIISKATIYLSVLQLHKIMQVMFRDVYKVLILILMK